MKAYQNLKSYLTLLTLLLLWPHLSSGQGNLVFNGGFDTDASGWTLINGAIYGSEKDVPNGVVHLFSRSPTSTTPSPTISQSINSLIPGQSYNVSGDFQKIIDWSGGTITGLSFGVALDGNFFYEATPENFNWQNFNFSYTATSSSAVLSIASQINGTEVSYDIDNLSIQAVPEPSIVGLIGLGGIVGAMFFRNRNRK